MDSLTDASMRALLDKNDRIRAMLGSASGVEHLVPSIVVVGAQSHGKSSVLEAVAGVKLPAGSGMVTKRPLMVQLRRGETDEVKFTPFVGANAKNIGKTEVAEHVTDETLRTDEIEAQLGNETGIVNLPMILRIQNADMPDVTLIDLPGITYKNGVEDRIKTLIDEYIMPASAIILVVHNASVDTETNEGFKRAKIVDPSGKRTLCVLTHVDMVANDSKLLEKNVTAFLDSSSSLRYIAVRNPGFTDHDSMTHANALKAEREFFATHPTLSKSKYRSITGSAALMKHVSVMYRDAVIASQKPIREELFRQRANIASELEHIPKSIPAASRFNELWMSTVHFLGSDAKVNATPKRQIFECCDKLSQSLLRIPKDLVKDKGSVKKLNLLVSALKDVNGTMLPNFMPYDPVKNFISEMVQVYATQAVNRLESCFEDSIKSIIDSVKSHLIEENPDELFEASIDLVENELISVTDEVISALNSRLSDSLLEETSIVLTCNHHYYKNTLDHLESIDSSGDTWAKDIQEVIEEHESFWLNDLCGGSHSLTSNTKTFFFTFCAYWKVFVKAFIDTIVKAAQCKLYYLKQHVLDHLKNVDDDVILESFACFQQTERRRAELEEKQEALENAQRMLDGGILRAIPRAISSAKCKMTFTASTKSTERFSSRFELLHFSEDETEE
ncbi:hypothetical protein HK100_012248 [Physocladia obscura]|uniref:Dynamin-type G domain-containing protein n=1 Tax=Physocladia obscura TaxID=109957 RepID=A0AAD5XGD4_9FUNG|nr:hypothetical protein HK100_012248 [Physocladia obscura]